MAVIARKHGISVDQNKAKIKVTFGNTVIASGEYYEKDGTFMMDIKGKSEKFNNASEIINYLTKHKIVEYKMTESEKNALGLFVKLMEETSAQSSVKGKGPDKKTNNKDNKVNDKTKTDIKKNKEAVDGVAGDTLKAHSTSKKDSESIDADDTDNKKTRKEIEDNDLTKPVKYPGK